MSAERIYFNWENEEDTGNSSGDANGAYDMSVLDDEIDEIAEAIHWSEREAELRKKKNEQRFIVENGEVIEIQDENQNHQQIENTSNDQKGNGTQACLELTIRSHLTDLIFQRAHPSCDGKSVCGKRCLSRADLDTLANMVRVEFYTAIRKELGERTYGWKQRTNDQPRPYDVFLSNQLLPAHRQSAPFIICWPQNAGSGQKQRELCWKDSENNDWELKQDPPFHVRRVASLLGAFRILLPLMSEPTEGTLMDLAMKREMIVEAASLCDEEVLSHVDSKIVDTMNASQKQVISTVLSPNFVQGFLVVHGHAGTGKTRCIIGCCDALKRGVIVCAPSNAAVANAALKLIDLERFGIADVCVFGKNCDDSVHFLNPFHRGNRFQSFLKSYNSIQNETKKKEKLRDFASWLHLDPEEASLQNMAILCPTVNNEASFISRASIVLCSVNNAGSNILRNAAQNKFHTLLLDEATQLPEAEFYVTTTFPGIRRIVVVGDPNQLPATVLDDKCRRSGFGTSWNANVSRVLPGKVHTLDMQYRMDPKILEFPNNYFYDKKISSADTVFGRLPYVSLPFLFVDTKQLGSEEKVKYGYQNRYEATLIKSILSSDEDIRRVLDSDCPRIIIITPFKAQADLLKSELNKMMARRCSNWEVNTIDNFQGQEADVVIISTVRTESTSDVLDDKQRLNLALTRAKRVVRIVGDITFFLSLQSKSTLRMLAAHVKKMDLVQNTRVTDASRPPDWTTVTVWKPTMTPRFYNCLKGHNQKDMCVAFNTVLAIATPDLKSLVGQPYVATKAHWHISALKKFSSKVQVVWVAKDSGDNPIVEAHFIGTYSECCQFVQGHPVVPNGTVVPKGDMSGVDRSVTETNNSSKQQLDISWALDNNIQNSILDDKIKELPEGSFVLDPEQEKVVRLEPPLLLESRSGTGKTNVLFQHAVAYARDIDAAKIKPICFVTVSPRLRKELQRRYQEIEDMENVALPPIIFFSFRDLLDRLLKMRGLDMNMASACCFKDFVHSRKAHSDLEVDVCLTENEIGGVITGSLQSAIDKESLSCSKYLSEKRSNVPNDSEEGINRRKDIYNIFEQYRKWKVANAKYDLNDIVLSLIASCAGMTEIFQGCYLDEIQDFSYASIHLILSLAGTEKLRWVCAGDTAQMISPGCSFKFEGLKQTMLDVRPGIEFQLKETTRLLKNYRMTKGVLEVGNAILRVLKAHFPGSINSSKPEIPMKDLGISVLLCNWDECLKKRANFGTDQALIYSSSDNSDGIASEMGVWLKNHPFILTSLDSKGLEFEDVIVAFDLERKAWNVDLKSAASLRMLRELYVSVTRARRRVVILVKKCTMMNDFLLNRLQCDLEIAEPEVIEVEFDSKTTSEDWFNKGKEMFDDEQYKYAANCFNAAGSLGWSNWAQGLYLSQSGRREDGASSLRVSARFFFANADFEHVLDLMKEIAKIPPWDSDDDEMFDEARKQAPDYLPRHEMLKMDLDRNIWDGVKVTDLKETSTATLFYAHREKAELMNIIESCSNEDRVDIAKQLPSIVGDYHFTNQRFSESAKLYLLGHDHDLAEKATMKAIEEAKSSDSDRDLIAIVEAWDRNEKAKRKLSKTTATSLLIMLYRSPAKAASSYASECMQLFGREVVKDAVISSKLGLEELHQFDEDTFEQDVTAGLLAKYENNLIGVVRWYIRRQDEKSASKFVEERIDIWSDEELLDIVVEELKLSDITCLIDEFAKRNLLVKAAAIYLKEEVWNVDMAVKMSNEALDSIPKAEQNCEKLLEIWPKEKVKECSSVLLDSNNMNANIVVFLSLFENPKNASNNYPRRCMTRFGKNVVEKAVLMSSKEGIHTKSTISILHKFDKKQFKSIKLPEKTATSATVATRAPQSVKETASRNPNSSSQGDIIGRFRPKKGVETMVSFLQEIQTGSVSGKERSKQTLTSSAAAARKPQDVTDLFAVGDRVILHGLSKAPQLNGQRGKVSGPLDVSTGRYSISLDSKDKAVSVKPTNIKREEKKQTRSKKKNSQKSRPKSRGRSDEDDESSSDGEDVPFLDDYDSESESSDNDSSSSESDIPPLRKGSNSSDRSREFDDEEDSDSDDDSIPHLLEDQYDSHDDDSDSSTSS